MMKIKERVYNLIRDDDDNNFASNLFDGVITVSYTHLDVYKRQGLHVAESHLYMVISI